MIVVRHINAYALLLGGQGCQVELKYVNIKTNQHVLYSVRTNIRLNSKLIVNSLFYRQRFMLYGKKGE